MNIEIINM